MINLKQLILEKKGNQKKITRDAFLYMDPKGDKETFAQCFSCKLWMGKDKNKCSIMGDTNVTGVMSCNLYVNGTPNPNQKQTSSVTPKEAGLVNRKVRCENCRSFDPDTSKCMLYQTLSKTNNDIFDLDENVNEYGCCNFNMPK